MFFEINSQDDLPKNKNGVLVPVHSCFFATLHPFAAALPLFFCSAQKLSFLKPSYVDPNFGRVAPNTSGQGTGYKGLEQMVDFGRVPFELS